MDLDDELTLVDELNSSPGTWKSPSRANEKSKPSRDAKKSKDNPSSLNFGQSTPAQHTQSPPSVQKHQGCRVEHNSQPESHAATTAPRVRTVKLGELRVSSDELSSPDPLQGDTPEPYSSAHSRVDNMSSYLESQRAAFKGALSSAASKIQTKKTVIPRAPASPSPSIGSTTSRNEPATTTSTPPGKRKRTDIVYSQPENTNFGDQIGTQMHFALTYLREKNGPKSLDDILGHLSLMKHSEQYKETFTEMIRRHPRVEFIPQPDVTEQKWNVGKYTYRPIIPGVKDKTSLLKFLQNRKDASGVAVKDLKDGWPDCEPALAELETLHKVLVIRTKKENNPKHVYLDDPSLSCEIDQEFKNMWLRVPIPKPEELPRKLQAVGQKPTSDDPTAGGKIVAAKPKPQKKRTTKRVGKVTNTHMEGVLKDFSHLKR